MYVAIFAIALSVTIREFGIAKAPGWTVQASRDGWFVSGIDPSGPAAGRIDPGQRLLAINRDERAAILGTSY